jgi:catalase
MIRVLLHSVQSIIASDVPRTGVHVVTYRYPVLLITFVLLVSPSLAQTSPESQAVDALQTLFGAHKGVRSNHAKGVLVEGIFTASGAGAGLTRAPHFRAGTVPVLVRFSDATGIPAIPDGSPDANPHGMAVKFKLPSGEMDLVAVSLPVFPVSTVEEFRDLILAVAASGPDAAKPTPIESFVAQHPAVVASSNGVGTPASFATEQYNGLNAFLFVDSAGNKTAYRYQIVPTAGVLHLDKETAAQKDPNFLAQDLSRKLAAGPVTFKLVAQIAGPGDPTNDATKAWPSDRRRVDLGTISLDRQPGDGEARMRELLFLPGQLADGIEPSDDPLIASRDSAYADSFGRRSQ